MNKERYTPEELALLGDAMDQDTDALAGRRESSSSNTPPTNKLSLRLTTMSGLPGPQIRLFAPLACQGDAWLLVTMTIRVALLMWQMTTGFSLPTIDIVME
jgi:hypothetical protein